MSHDVMDHKDVPAHAERHSLDDFLMSQGSAPSRYSPATDQKLPKVFKCPRCSKTHKIPKTVILFKLPPSQCDGCGLYVLNTQHGLYIWD